jgi:mRNA interferase RelE/StbE
MNWAIEFERQALKELDRLDPPIRKRLLEFLLLRLAPLDNPRSIGTALVGTEFSGLWRYRVGDYRIITRIEDEKIQVVVVRVSHRRDAYR